MPNTLTAFFAIIDLLAIAPYYLEIALQADTVSTPNRPTQEAGAHTHPLSLNRYDLSILAVTKLS